MDNDSSALQQLNHLRWLALVLLGFMVVIFVMSTVREPAYPWLAWVRAFAEAAMVGALADWFAVTALFRHPLGIPIPHTAIIPANKDRVAETIGKFIAENFLSDEAIERKITSSDLSKTFGDWLAQPENAEKSAAKIVSIFPDLVGALNDEEISRFLRGNAERALRGIDAAPVLGQLLDVLTVGDRHQEILDSLLSYSQELIERHQAFIRDTVREAMPWYVPKFVHDQVYSSVIKRIKDWIVEINSDSEHEMRKHFREATQDFISDLRSSPRFAQEGEKIRDWLITHPVLRQYLNGVWGDVKAAALKDASAENSVIRKVCAESLAAFGRSITVDEAFKQRLNNRLADWASKFVSRYGESISGFVAETVRGWDEDTIVEKLELSVGRDLQYIRLNGTMVGGLIGLLVHAAGLLILSR